jgi:hypothetical protein
MFFTDTCKETTVFCISILYYCCSFGRSVDKSKKSCCLFVSFWKSGLIRKLKTFLLIASVEVEAYLVLIHPWNFECETDLN